METHGIGWRDITVGAAGTGNAIKRDGYDLRILGVLHGKLAR
jgi:hypothetical protein